MRLIDADALIERISREVITYTGGRNLYTVGLETAELFALEAPTIEAEPVRRGKWLPHPMYKDWRVCSVCGIGTEIVRHEAGATTEYNYKHCPWCGARLEVEDYDK